MEVYEKFRLMKITDHTLGHKQKIYECSHIRDMKRFINKHKIEPSEKMVIEMDNYYSNTTREIDITDFYNKASVEFKSYVGSYTIRKFV